MKKIILLSIITCIFLQIHCKKNYPCIEDICSINRATKKWAINERGVMGTFTTNTESRWMINVFDDTPGLKMTCILCGDFPDSFKVMNKAIVFSGALKDACGIVDAEDLDRYYIVNPTAIR